MNESKYYRLVTVDTGDGLRVARVGRGILVFAGDLVSLDTDETGVAIAVLFIEEGSDGYAFIANLNPIYEATVVYRRIWTKEEPNADS